MMKIFLAAACLMAMAGLGGCAGQLISDGPGVRTEARSPIVISSLSFDNTISPPTATLREQQVDLVAVLTQGIEQSGFRVDASKYFNYPHKATRAPGSTAIAETADGAAQLEDGILYVGGLTPDQTVSVLMTFVETLPSSKKKIVRTAVAAQLLAASDSNCAVYVQSLRGAQVASRLSTDVLTAVFSAQGALAKFDGTARRMASYAGFTNAVGATIDRDIYAQEAAELIADSIVKQRDKMEPILRARFNETYDAWPIGSVLADVSNYHQECSATRGLARMRDTIIAREQTIQAVHRAAAEVEKNGGSGKEVLAVLSGGLDESDQDRATTPYLTPVLAAGREDLDNLAEKAGKCGNEIVTGKAYTTKGVAALEACKDVSTNTLYNDWVKKYRDAMDETKPEFKALSNAVAAAKDDKAKLQAATEAQDKAYIAMRQKVADDIELIAANIALGRDRAAFSLDTQKPDVTWKELQANLKGDFDSSDPLDPAILAAVATEPGVKGQALVDLVKMAWKSVYETAIEANKPT